MVQIFFSNTNKRKLILVNRTNGKKTIADHVSSGFLNLLNISLIHQGVKNRIGSGSGNLQKATEIGNSQAISCIGQIADQIQGTVNCLHRIVFRFDTEVIFHFSSPAIERHHFAVLHSVI